jgi:membrane protein GlpM
MDWMLKALVGAAAVILIQLFAQSKSYYLAGLVPLFPTFALISHYLVGTQRPVTELRETIVFGMLALIPYALYLASLYFLVGRYKLFTALAGATVVWIFTAGILITLWQKG